MEILISHPGPSTIFFGEAQMCVIIANKKLLAHQDKKMKAKEKQGKKSKKVVESSDEKVSEEEVDSDGMDATPGPSKCGSKKGK